MLIAIMSDSFENVFENRHVAILKLKAKVMSDFVFVIKDKSDAYKFLFFAMQTIKEVSDDETWEGKIKAIRKVIEINI